MPNNLKIDTSRFGLNPQAQLSEEEKTFWNNNPAWRFVDPNDMDYDTYKRTNGGKFNSPYDLPYPAYEKAFAKARAAYLKNSVYGLNGITQKQYTDWENEAKKRHADDWDSYSDQFKKTSFIVQMAAKRLRGKTNSEGNPYTDDWFNKASLRDIEEAYNNDVMNSIRGSQGRLNNPDVMKNALSADLDGENGDAVRKQLISMFDEIADKGSPLYRRYVSQNEGDYATDRFTMTDDDKVNVMVDALAHGYAMRDENSVAEYLTDKVNDNINGNQPWSEKVWYGAKQFGRNAWSTAVDLGAMAYGTGKAVHTLYDRATGNNGSSDDKDLSLSAALSNDFFQNSWAQYANDMLEYGDVDTDIITRNKYGVTSSNPYVLAELMNMGVDVASGKAPSQVQLIQAEQRVIDKIKNGQYDEHALAQMQQNTLGSDEEVDTSTLLGWTVDALGQYGFTAASMFVGAGESKILQGMAKGARALARGEKAMSRIQRFEKTGQAYGIPITTASIEAAQEATSNGQQTLEQARQAIDKRENDYVDRQLSKDYENRNLQRQAFNQLGLHYVLVNKGIKTAGSGDNRVMTFNNKRQLVYTGKDGKEYKVSDSQARQMIKDQIRKNREATHRKNFQPQRDDLETRARNDAAISQGIDFGGNMVLLGGMNSTLQAVQQVPRVRSAMNAIRKGTVRNGVDGWHFNTQLFGNSRVGQAIGRGLDRTVNKAGKFFNNGAEPENRHYRTAKNPDGTWSVTSKLMTGLEKAYHIGKESLGEGLEEAEQNAISSGASEGAMNDFTSYMNAKYDEDGRQRTKDEMNKRMSSILGDLGATLKGGFDGLTSMESLDAFLSAAFSTAAGGININTNYRGFGGTSRSPITWRSGLYEGYKEMQRQDEQRAKAAAQLQEMLNSPQMKAAVNGQISATSYAKSVVDAAQSDDEMSFRDSRLGQTVSVATALDELKGTEWARSMQNQISFQASLTADDVAPIQDSDDEATKLRKKQAQQMVSDYKDQLKEMGTKDEEMPSDEEAVKQLAKNAQNTTDVFNQINEEGQNVDRTFGADLDKDVRASLIHAAIINKDRIRRRDQLQEETQKAEEGVQNSENYLRATVTTDDTGGTVTIDQRPINTSTTEAQKKVVVKYGSYENLERNIRKASQRIEQLDDEIKNTEDAREKAQLKAEKKNLEDFTKQAYQDRNAYRESKGFNGERAEGNEFHNDTQDVITEREIAGLSSRDKTILLNPRNKKNFSQAQREAIDNYLAQVKAKDADYTKKVQDLNRLNRAIKNYQSYYDDINNNAQAFNGYANQIRQIVAKRDILNGAAAKKLRALSRGATIDDDGNITENGDAETSYTQFKNAYNDWVKTASPAERYIIEEQLFKDRGKNYTRFANDEREKQNIIAGSKLGDNDRDIMRAAFQYLESRGIKKVTDVDKALQTLGAVDPETQNGSDYKAGLHTGEGSAFINFIIKTYNNGKSENERIELDDTESDRDFIERVYKMYKDAVTQYNERVERKKAAQAKSKAQQQQQQQGEDDEAPSNISTDDLPTDLTKEEKLIADEMKGQKLRKVMLTALISTRLPNNATDKEKQNHNKALEGVAVKIKEYIEKHGGKPLDSAGLTDAIQEAINDYDAKKDQASEGIAKELTKILNAVQKASIDIANRESDSDSAPAPQGGDDTSHVSYIETVNIESLINEAEGEEQLDAQGNKLSEVYSKVISWYKNKGIESTLNKYAKEYSSEKTNLVYYTDPDLTAAVRDSMIDAYGEWSEDNPKGYKEDRDLPIVVGIQVADNQMQPLAILANIGGEKAGSAWVQAIREQALQQEEKTPITDKDGAVITSRIYRNHAEGEGFQTKGQEHLTVSSLLEKEAAKSGDKSLVNVDNLFSRLFNKKEQKKNKWKEALGEFLEKLRIKGNNKGGKKLVYVLDKQDGTTTDCTVIIPEIRDTKDKDGKTLFDFLNSTDPKDWKKAVHYNHRIERLLSNLIDRFKDASKAVDNGVKDNDQFDYSQEQIGSLGNLIDEVGFRNTIDNILRLCDGSMGVKVSVSGTKETGLSINLFLIKGGQEDKLLYTYDIGKQLTTEELEKKEAQFLSALLTDENGVERQRKRINDDGQSTDEPAFKWQVSFNDFAPTDQEKKDRTPKQKEAIQASIEEIVKDGLITLDVRGLNYTNHQLVLTSPYKFQQGTSDIIRTPDSSPNKNNGNTNPPKGVQQGDKEGAVDSNTGAPIGEGDNTPPSNIKSGFQKAQEIADKITHDKDAPRLENPNDDAYVSEKKGKKTFWQRVTSLIYANPKEKGTKPGEAKVGSYLWSSSRIGNSVDIFVRDFFNHDLDGLTDEQLEERYPNATGEDWRLFREQLEGIRASFDRQGITIIPKDVTLYGTVTVTDDNGKKHKINVAGTVDLLGYDRDGNFHIYDMKTFRTSMGRYYDKDNNVKDDKQAHYAAQLNLYKALLYQQYLEGTGLAVVETKLIPIKVDYPPEHNGNTGLSKKDQNVVEDASYPMSYQLNWQTVDGNTWTDSHGNHHTNIIPKEFRAARPRIVPFDNSTRAAEGEAKPITKEVHLDNSPYSPVATEFVVSEKDYLSTDYFIDVYTNEKPEFDWNKLDKTLQEQLLGEQPEEQGEVGKPEHVEVEGGSSDTKEALENSGAQIVRPQKGKGRGRGTGDNRRGRGSGKQEADKLDRQAAVDWGAVFNYDGVFADMRWESLTDFQRKTLQAQDGTKLNSKEAYEKYLKDEISKGRSATEICHSIECSSGSKFPILKKK